MSALYLFLFLVAPLYVWRFSASGFGVTLPTNLLMVVSFVVIIIAVIELFVGKSERLLEFKDYIKSLPKLLLLGVIFVGLASLISLFAFGLTTVKLGQWVVLYAQPLAIFLLLSFYAARNPHIVRQLKIFAFIFLLVAGVLAIVQYFTLWTLPADWQGNLNEPKRAIAFFAHPNAYALFATPLLAWLMPSLLEPSAKLWRILVGKESWLSQSKEIAKQKFYTAAWLVGAVGVFLSLSRGAWLGLLVAIGVYAILAANKKVLLTFAVGVVMIAGIVAVVPNLRWRVMLPFYGEKSSVARLSLWQTGTKMIIDSPILGKGISGFDTNWGKFNSDQNLNHYNFPHNILLNFWVDLGLLGVLGFALIFIWIVWQGVVSRKKHWAIGLLLFTVALLVHGLIDIPYLKNDLALIFWMVLAVSVASWSTLRVDKTL